MNNHILNFIGITFFVLAACDSSSDDEFNHTIEQNKTYLVYESAQSLIAIDPQAPQHPITIEPTNNTLSGIRIANNLINVANIGEVSLRVNDTLVYARDGKIWRTSLDLDRTPTIERISSEDGAYNVCYANIISALQKPIYYYSLPGADQVCFATPSADNSGENLPIIPDEVARWTPLDADAMTPPESGGISRYTISPGNSVLFFDTSEYFRLEISGLLKLDNSGALLWYEGRNFTTPAYTVASNVIDFESTFIEYKNAAYIIVNGNLYRYQAKDSALGESLYEMQTPGFSTDTADRYAPGIKYLIDGANLLALDITKSTPAVLLAHNELFSEGVRLLGTTPHHVIFFKQLADGFTMYSVGKQNSEILELFTVAKTLAQYGPEAYIDQEFIYYTDRINSLSGFVSADGKVKSTLPDMLIIDRISNPVVGSSQPYYSHLLLAKVTSATTVEVVSFGTQSKSIERALGILPKSVLDMRSSSSLPNNGYFLLSAYVDTGWEVFFADLHQDDSLRQLTYNDITEKLFTDYSILQPQPLPPTPAPTPTPVPTPVPTPTPSPTPMPNPTPTSSPTPIPPPLPGHGGLGGKAPPLP